MKAGWVQDATTHKWHWFDPYQASSWYDKTYACGIGQNPITDRGQPKPGKGKVCKNCLRIDKANKKKKGR